MIFNTSTAEPNDDIGILAALNSLPREVLGTTFGVGPSAFAKVPTTLKPVVITKRS
ncbi:hypothetical protein [Sciscionella marina]|uniref:hypothetical protein n=1 Tax=Sciscionella marina TaxID=508770 RepID=UPI0003A52758|nr:hypothetical protein [Sciscionella marina]